MDKVVRFNILGRVTTSWTYSNIYQFVCTVQGSDAVRLSGVSEAISQQIAKYDSSEFDDDKVRNWITLQGQDEVKIE